MGCIISLIVSACIGDETFHSVAPEFARKTGNELNAVVLQTVLCGVLGVGFAAASVIWELDSWSLVKQSGVYFLVIGLLFLPIAYVTNWMQFRSRVPFLFRNFYRHFLCYLAFSIFMLEATNQKNKRSRSSRKRSIKYYTILLER